MIYLLFKAWCRQRCFRPWVLPVPGKPAALRESASPLGRLASYLFWTKVLYWKTKNMQPTSTNYQFSQTLRGLNFWIKNPIEPNQHVFIGQSRVFSRTPLFLSTSRTLYCETGRGIIHVAALMASLKPPFRSRVARLDSFLTSGYNKSTTNQQPTAAKRRICWQHRTSWTLERICWAFLRSWAVHISKSSKWRVSNLNKNGTPNQQKQRPEYSNKI